MYLSLKRCNVSFKEFNRQDMQRLNYVQTNSIRSYSFTICILYCAPISVLRKIDTMDRTRNGHTRFRMEFRYKHRPQWYSCFSVVSALRILTIELLVSCSRSCDIHAICIQDIFDSTNKRCFLIVGEV